MMIEAISALTALPELAPAATVVRPPDAGASFAQQIEQGVGSVNQSIDAADASTRALAAGADIPVHDVMIALEKARLDLQFAVQLRNRLVAAYQNIVSMQV